MGCRQQHRDRAASDHRLFYSGFSLPHEFGVAVLFMTALVAFIVSLVSFTNEVRLAVMDFEHLK